MNPAILKNVAPENYGVHVPKGTGKQLMATLQLIPPEHRTSWRIHRVAPGDTLVSIGKQYGVSSTSLMAANRLEKPEAVEGDRLIIPTDPRPEAPAVRRPAARSAASVHRRAPGQRPATTLASSARRPARAASR